MELGDVKYLIKGLLAGANGESSIPHLLLDFENETGAEMPYFNFPNPRDFLLTLTDIIRVARIREEDRVMLLSREMLPSLSRHIEGSVRIPPPPRRPYEHPDFSVKRTAFGERMWSLDMDSFMTAYQTGWVTLDEAGRFKRVQRRYASERRWEENLLEEIEFLFSDDDWYFGNDFPARREGVSEFVRLIGNVQGYTVEANPDNESYPFLYTRIPRGVMASIKKFIKSQEDPVKFDDHFLPHLFHQCDIFNYREFGFRTVFEMVKSLKDVFRCLRTEDGRWFILDATRAPNSYEDDMYTKSCCRFPMKTQWRIMRLVDKYCEATFEHGIRRDDFLALYYKAFGEKLDFMKYGFPSLNTFLSKLDGKVVKIEYFSGDFYVSPIVDIFKLKYRSVFSLSPNDDAYKDLFPADCIGHGVKYREMKPEYYFKQNRRTRVSLSSVSSPHKFYFRLKETIPEYETLMKDMCNFYSVRKDRYRMPDATIRENQICVTIERKRNWDVYHRSIIVSVLTRREVLVLLVDSGKEIKVDKERLRFLHCSFHSVRKQAFLARIFDVKPAFGIWDCVSRAYFRQLLARRTDVFFRTIEYDPTKEVTELLGELLIIENNRPESVSRLLVSKFKLGKWLRASERHVFRDAFDYGTYLQLSSVLRCGTLVCRHITVERKFLRPTVRSVRLGLNAGMRSDDFFFLDDTCFRPIRPPLTFWETVWLGLREPRLPTPAVRIRVAMRHSLRESRVGRQESNEPNYISEL